MRRVTDLPTRVKATMAERGVNQAQLGKECGYTQGHISKLLRQTELPSKAEVALKRWIECEPPVLGRAAMIESSDILRLGNLLKKKCDELARLQRRLEKVTIPAGNRQE